MMDYSDLLASSRAVLFDFDGVLVDTEPQYDRFWQEQTRRFFPHIPDLPRRIKGATLEQIKAQYLDTVPGATERIVEALHHLESHMTFDYVPGAEAFVRHLHTLGVPTAIVTSSDRPKMAQALRVRSELPGLVSLILTAEDFHRSKPAPDGYLLAAERLGVDIKACTVFEDSLNGLLSARASGARVVGLTTTLPYTAVAPHADKVIENFIV